MSSSEKYRPWLTLSISHEYYVRNSCPVILKPLPETRLVLAKHNILFSMQKTAQWILLIEEKFNPKELTDNEFELVFGLYPQENKFYYVSQNPVGNNDAFFINEAPIPKMWRNVKLNLQHIIDNNLQRIDILITSPEKHYEYICIPKYHDSSINIKLDEGRNRISFNEKENIPIADIRNALRFLSKDKVRLSENNDDFKIQLWEIMESGERLLCNSMPLPQPGEASLLEPKDSITTYFYF